MVRTWLGLVEAGEWTGRMTYMLAYTSLAGFGQGRIYGGGRESGVWYLTELGHTG